MKQLTEHKRQVILEEVRAEFPDDEMIQELHYIRRIHREQTAGLSVKELIAFYQADEERK